MKSSARLNRETTLLLLATAITLVFVSSAYIIIARNRHLSDSLYKVFICSGLTAVWWKWVA